MAELIRATSQGTPSTERYRCKKCDSRFETVIVFDLPVDQVVAQWNALQCPSCGAGLKSILMGECRRLSEDRQDRLAAGMTDKRAILTREEWWRRAGETGLSSKAVAAHMSGKSSDATKWHFPADLDDLRRIMLLLDLIPEWKGRMAELGGRSTVWAKIALVWYQIADAYVRDAKDFRGGSEEAGRLLEEAIAQDREI